jgi:hypothetical protein
MADGMIVLIKEDGRMEVEISDLEPPRWKIDEMAGLTMMATFTWSYFMGERATVFRPFGGDAHGINDLASELVKLDRQNTWNIQHGPIIILTGVCSYWNKEKVAIYDQW